MRDLRMRFWCRRHRLAFPITDQRALLSTSMINTVRAWLHQSTVAPGMTMMPIWAEIAQAVGLDPLGDVHPDGYRTLNASTWNMACRCAFRRRTAFDRVR